MGRKPKRNPSFFKVLINNDFTRQLRLPPVFAQKYRGILPENAELRICSGETWGVRVEQMDDDHCYFTRGWTKFTKNMELEKLEFLVFWFTGNSTFDVSVYGITGCEKEPLRRTCRGLKYKQSRTRIVENEAAWTDEETKSENSNPHFEIVLNRHRSSRVCVAKHFAEAAGLIGKKKVALEYPGGHHSFVVLDLRSQKSHFKLDMAAGWPEFRKANRLAFGKTYSFEFIPSKKVIQVKQIKKKEV